MTKDPAFLFYPGDYLKDTQNFTENQQVAYDRIMCEHMRNICSVIGVSKAQVNFFTKRLSLDEKKELLFFLKEINGVYQIEWVAESIEKRRAYSNSRRQNKQKDMTNISSTHEEHSEDENVIVNEDEIISGYDFENFWNDYNKKVGDKEKIEKKFNKLSEGVRALIKLYIPEYVKSTPDKQFRKNPETFLNQKGWEHELIYNNNNGNNTKTRTKSGQNPNAFTDIADRKTY